LEASSATFSPVFATGPFEVVLLVLGLFARDEEPLRLRVAFLLREAFAVPFLVDLFELERLRVDRLLEDFVVWAI
jgi:hypothetical protein